MDGLGVMLASTPAACSRLIQRYVRESQTPGASAVVGTGIVTSAPLATLANGVAGHAEDFDDTHLSQTPDRIYGLLTHPTVPVLATALAVGQDDAHLFFWRADGRDPVRGHPYCRDSRLEGAAAGKPWEPYAPRQLTDLGQVALLVPRVTAMACSRLGDHGTLCRYPSA